MAILQKNAIIIYWKGGVCLPENYTNRGEYRTYKLLKELSDKYPEDDFHIFANLYLESDDDRDPNRQVDHLVVCRKGIFMFETKYWTGQVYHNVTRDQLISLVNPAKGQPNKAAIKLLTSLLPDKVTRENQESFTMTIKSPENIEVYNGTSNPITQVQLSGLTLNRLIDKKLRRAGIKPYIHEFVFYNYVSRSGDDEVIDLNGVLDKPYSDDYNDWGEGFTNASRLRKFYQDVHDNLPDKLGLKPRQVEKITDLIHRQIVLD
ncbi:hypothetical protein GPK34_05820 [Secundilactobacillus kimchicus]|nr:hypothetical protein [Secundilactobacillus kimchicus]